MRTSILAFFILGNLSAVADGGNILKNGDFSNGVNHWEGDCHTIDNASVDLTQSTPSTGVVVKLQHGEWTKVTQDFEGKIGEYKASVTYTVSPDLKFSTDPKDYVNVPGLVGFNRLRPFNSKQGDWVLIILDLGAMHYNYWAITPKLDSSIAQTVNAPIQLDSDDSVNKGFFLIFPPGDGYITLQSISLSPTAASTPSNP